MQAQPNLAIGTLALGVVFMLVLGTVVLLAFKQTRPIGIALLSLVMVGIVGVLVVGSYFWARHSDAVHIARIEQHRKTQEAEIAARTRVAIRVDSPPPPTEAPSAAATSSPPEAAPAPAAAEPASTPAEPPSKPAEPTAQSTDKPSAEAPPADKPAGESPAAATTPVEKPPAAKPQPTDKPAVDKPSADKPPAEALPAPIPAWLNQKPRIEGNTYHATIESGPFTTEQECIQALDAKLQRAARDYVERWQGAEAAHLAQLDLPYLKTHVLKATYRDEVHHSFGLMQRLYGKLEFDDRTRDEIMRRLRDAIVSARLTRLSGAVGLVLGVLAIGLGYLKADHATGGAYRQRLQLAAGGAILLVVAGATLLI
jgi:hypothetical protein